MRCGYKTDTGAGEQVERGAAQTKVDRVPPDKRGVPGGAGGPEAAVERREDRAINSGW